LPVEWLQAGKSITGILKPLEILTRPQLPRSKPSAGATAAAAAATTAHQAAAASTQGAGSAAGANEAAAGGSGSQTVQHSTAPAEVCSVHQLSKLHCCLVSLQRIGRKPMSSLWLHVLAQASTMVVHGNPVSSAHCHPSKLAS